MAKERIHFRLIQTPCCNHLLCWVNPRLPTYCPECGRFIYRQLRFELGHILSESREAWIEYSTPTPPIKPEGG